MQENMNFAKRIRYNKIMCVYKVPGQNDANMVQSMKRTEAQIKVKLMCQP